MRLIAALGCAALLASPVCAETMLFDFGNTARQTAGNWNNVVPATTDLFAIFNSDGAVVPGVTFSITDEFFQTGEPSQLGSESPAGDAAGYPVDATDDYFFGHTGPFAGADDNPYGEVRLSGLDPGTAYNFTFFSARNGVNDNRETMFTVSGANTLSGVAVTSNNDTEVLRIMGVTPTAGGDISVGVQAGPGNDNNNGFFYVNLMQVDTIPEPTGAVLALAAGLLASFRRVRS